MFLSMFVSVVDMSFGVVICVFDLCSSCSRFFALGVCYAIFVICCYISALCRDCCSMLLVCCAFPVIVLLLACICVHECCYACSI